MKRLFLTWLVVICGVVGATAQHFYNLTAEEVKIDSLLPYVSYSWPLGTNYADSVYEVSIAYPEFLDMEEADVKRYQDITTEPLPELPTIQQYVGVSRKQGTLYAQFVPLVYRDGKYQKLVSFQLKIQTQPLKPTPKPLPCGRGAEIASRASSNQSSTPVREGLGVGSREGFGGGFEGLGVGIYSTHSVLATGSWAKIRVPETGFYELTDALLKKAGFNHPKKVKIYGYGGALQPETLTGDYLADTDDLKEVTTCMMNGKRIFHADGPVSWSSNTTLARTRNPYSDYGYYFLTESEEDVVTTDSATFFDAYYPAASDYHDLYEVDDYAWYHSGRNLYTSEKLTVGSDRTITLPGVHSTTTQLNVNLSYDSKFTATLLMNGTTIGTLTATSGLTSSGELSDGNAVATQSSWKFSIPDTVMKATDNKLTLRQTSGGEVRLDYVSLYYSTPKPLLDFKTASVPVPEYLYRITNQDHHADSAVDMVIIIPTSQKLLSEAERLKTLHETYDSLRVRIIPADELYNEFSSGTPDANAYRRYMKMLYDRAATDDDQPRYLLLFGDGAWDNRMLSSSWRSQSPDDFLLCYESENSFSTTKSYVSDDYFCLLDDGEGGSILKDKFDAAVGRLSARTAEEAKTLVDKIYAYRTNAYAGAWQNTLCFLGDDGDQNRHMMDAEAVVNTVKSLYSSYDIKKIYWDAYTRVTSSTGNSFPDVTRLIKQQFQTGALVMNYSGHGGPSLLSHEGALRITDFSEASSLRLPLWITAACDVAPFDGQSDNIAETAMLNKKGGSIAFYGTARTVYASYNRMQNQSFMKYVLGSENGRRLTIGEAAYLAKNDFTSGSTELLTNKLQYVLLGDPALTLASPTEQAVIDSINGKSVADGILQLKAGSKVTLKGHLPDHPDFNGVVTVTVRDIEETIVGKQNDPVATETALEFQDRPNTIYSGSDSVRAGQFTFSFAVPRDISYSDKTGLFLIYAINNDKTLTAHGENENFTLAGTEELVNDGVGPSIYCYLNSESFVNGGTVNATPYFFAEVTDKDGINVSGAGIGHDLELIIDNDMSMTYQLNNRFQYDFGDYCKGTVDYVLPELTDGPHKLLFRAWDAQNNSSVAELSFVVNATQQPSLSNVICTKNPATTSTSFIISHDRAGSEVDVELEVFDTSGRLLWRKSETGIPTDHTYTIDWDLTTGNGSRLKTGVYLYRVLISNNGSSKASQAKKLIVL